MKTVNIYLDDEEHSKFKLSKGSKSWKAFFLEGK